MYALLTAYLLRKCYSPQPFDIEPGVGGGTGNRSTDVVAKGCAAGVYQRTGGWCAIQPGTTTVEGFGLFILTFDAEKIVSG